MVYGVKIYNDSNILIIDATYTNYVLWEHGENIDTVDQGSYHDKTIAFSSNSVKPPLIAIKPDTDDYLGLVYYTKSGANYSGFNVRSEDKIVTFSWQAFVPRIDESAEVYGLRIFNDTPELVYDSGYTPMIIIDVDTASPAYNSVVTITHPSYSGAYYIMTPWGWQQRISEWNGSFSIIRNYGPMFKSLSATQVSFGGVQNSQGSIPVELDQLRGFWPDPWTIITVEKAF